MPVVLFRVDASSRLGLGHLRRCISLALALRRQGADVHFLYAQSDLDCDEVLGSVGISSTCLQSTIAGAAEDAAAFIKAAISLRPDWIVVDHYHLDADWHEAVSQGLGCRLAVIDDLADRPLSADALIDHNWLPPSGHREKYRRCLRKQPDQCFFGPRFALLDAAYCGSLRFMVRSDVNSIGIFLGGTDPAQLTVDVLKACRVVAGFNGPIEIVSTNGNLGLGALKQAVADDKNASLSIDLPNLADFYRRHDLQIGAGGGASWERCAIGVPSLTLSVAENQRAVIPALAELGAIATTPNNSQLAIGQAVQALLASATQRQALTQISQALVDGLGAVRVALGLLSVFPAQLHVRPVTFTDAEMIWAWRNHPATRSVSRQKAEIPLDAHCRWLTKLMSSDHVMFQIGMVGQRPVGVVRFDPMPQVMGKEVSIYLDPALHGLGLGKRLLLAAEADLLSKKGPTVLHAEVLPDNRASAQLFLSAGYSATSPTTFVKNLPA